MDRKSVAAGEFYPANPEQLAEFIEKCKYLGAKSAFISLFVPNGRYSGAGDILAATLTRAFLPDTVILTGMNRTGFGEPISIWAEGGWDTPFGRLEVDSSLAREIIKCSKAKEDILAHVREYSIETVLPMLKYLKPNIKIVPISIMGMPRASLRAFAQDLSAFIGRSGAGLIICSGLCVGETSENIEEKEDLLIDAILSVDGESIYEIVMDTGAMMESVYPASASLMASFIAGARNGNIIGRKQGSAGIILS